MNHLNNLNLIWIPEIIIKKNGLIKNKSKNKCQKFTPKINQQYKKSNQLFKMLKKYFYLIKTNNQEQLEIG